MFSRKFHRRICNVNVKEGDDALQDVAVASASPQEREDEAQLNRLVKFVTLSSSGFDSF